MVKVFYHNDADGRCSAFWVRKYLEKEGISFDASDFIEMNYDKTFPSEILQENERVFMVDFSLDPVPMRSLDQLCDFTWIDHHKTAIDKMGDCNIKGIRQDGIAACALTWMYLIHRPQDTCDFIIGDAFNEYISRAPLFTQYIHLWDTWQWKKHKDRDKIEAFITALSVINTKPTGYESIWYLLSILSNLLDDLILEGKHMINYRNGYAEDLCDSIGKTIEFEGFKCFACNMAHCNSEWFASVDSTIYDILMPFYYNMNTGMFSVSLYGKGDIDVSKIAVKYGGGGHFGASGFQCKVLPWV